VVEFKVVKPFYSKEIKMNAKLVTLVAAPLLGLSSLSFAQDSLPTEQSAPAEPVMLSQAEMDGVTAGALVSVGDVKIIDDVTVKDNLNKNNVNVGVLQGVNIQRQ
jgi:hypothetical protein